MRTKNTQNNAILTVILTFFTPYVNVILSKLNNNYC